MKEFLNQNCYIAVDVRGRIFYYMRAAVTEVTDTHITFEDTLKDNEPHCFRIADIIEIKLSTKEAKK